MKRHILRRFLCLGTQVMTGIAKTGPYHEVRQEDSQERLEVQMAPRGTTPLSSGLQGQVGCKNPPVPFPRTPWMPSIQKPTTTHLEMEVSRRYNPKGDVQQHRHASPRCVLDWRTMPQPSLEVRARMLTCVNMRHVIQITWWNDHVNDLINRKRVTQFTHQNLSMQTQSSTFHINMMHHLQG